MKSRSKLLNFIVVMILWSGFPAFVCAEPTQELQVYIARDESPSQVLSYLLSLYGREVGGTTLPSRPVSGRFEVRSVADVMAYFERAYKISWYEYGSTVFIYRPSNWATERFYVGEYDASADWQEMLANAGLNQPKFNVFYSRQQKELLVSGPKTYIDQVKRTFLTDKPVEVVTEPEPKKEEEKQKELMMFPLRYASVEDRTIQLREASYTTPGILTVLKEVLLGLNEQSDSEPNGDPYGFLANENLSSLAHPATTVSTARELVTSSVRGENAEPSSAFGGHAPKLGQNRDLQKESIHTPAKKYGTLGASGQGGVFVGADYRTNAILIRDFPEKYNYYKEIIDRLDKPISMIEVEAMLVEIDTTTLNQLGLEFGIGGTMNFEFPARDSLANPSPLINESLVGASSIVDPNTFVARLRALASDKQARVLSRPTIVTQDNVPAFIDLSETLYLQVQGERVAQVERVTAGSLLQVTPRLVEDGNQSQIFISVEIQDGVLQPGSQAASNPTVRNTKLNTQALIDRDKAILIGGYNREKNSEIEHKVPVLGSLPFVGAAFRSTENATQSFVRLFLITPRVLAQPAYFAKSTRDAAKLVQENFKNFDEGSVQAPPSLSLYKLDSSLSIQE